MTTMGERIKKYRKEKKYTQQQLADLLQVSVMTVRRFEANEREPKMEMVENLASVLGVSEIALMFGSPSEAGRAVLNGFSENLSNNLHDLAEHGLEIIQEQYANTPEFIVQYWERLNTVGRIEATKRTKQMYDSPEYKKDEK